MKHVLVGAHAISALAGDPRATMDVTLIANRPAQARNALAAAFTNLTIEEHPIQIQFKRQGREAINIIRPSAAPIFKLALKHTMPVKLASVHIDVPLVEMALALKFASMISLTRQAKDKYQDAHDFIEMAQHNRAIDLNKLAAFGEVIQTGGGAEITKLLNDARAGRVFAI